MNTTNTLSVSDIDRVIDEFNNFNLTINSNSSFLTVQQPQSDDNIMILGASFQRGIGGQNVDTTNKQNITTSFISIYQLVTNISIIQHKKHWRHPSLLLILIEIIIRLIIQ